MGRVLVRRLQEQGHVIRILALAGDPNAAEFENTATEIIYGSVAQKDDLKGICKNISVVYHLAAVIIADDQRVYDSVNVRGTENLIAEAHKSGVSHFIYISSASVVYPKPTPYSLSKRKAEEIVVQSGIPYTIIRPTLAYGEEGGLEFDMFLNYLRKFPVVPFIGRGKALKSPVYIGDIIDGLVKAGVTKKVTGKIYNFSGPDSIEIKEFSRLLLSLSGSKSKLIVPIPIAVCTVIAQILGIFMKRPPLRWSTIAGITQHANLDPSEAVIDLGYTPSSLKSKLPGCFPRFKQ